MTKQAAKRQMDAIIQRIYYNSLRELKSVEYGGSTPF
jgi:hypothetical protein